MNYHGDVHSHLLLSAFTFRSDPTIRSKTYEKNLQKSNKTRPPMESLLAVYKFISYNLKFKYKPEYDFF